jgi:2-oxoglutarate dehydrogenase E1 component
MKAGATVSSQVTGVGTSNDGEFGANEWLVAEMYDQFAKDRDSVDRAWWPVLEAYEKTQQDAPPRPLRGAPAAALPPPRRRRRPAPRDGTDPGRRRPAGRPHDDAPGLPQPVPAQAPSAADADPRGPRGRRHAAARHAEDPRREHGRSLTVPTATSVRTVPAKLMIDNRIVINNHMSRTRGGKVSFTHLIGWALIQALKAFPSQNVSYAEVDGKPSVVAPRTSTSASRSTFPSPTARAR